MTESHGTLYCVELLTTQWETMVAWYRTTLGLVGLIRIVEDRYALLQAGSTRVAILGRDNVASGAGRMRLVFEMPTLDVPPARVHPEGFREVRLVDPDGNDVRLIAWR